MYNEGGFPTNGKRLEIHKKAWRCRMRMEAFYWNSGQPLTEDYLHRFENTESLFDYHPWQEESWKRRAEWLDRRQLRRGPEGACRGAAAV
ncbi:hypothetical protein LJK88_19750 [Paenibacillus sp. P26]|nr:hypothetical protein LJK88_19750 [Paenibacillus sp. P26]